MKWNKPVLNQQFVNYFEANNNKVEPFLFAGVCVCVCFGFTDI